MNVDVTRSTKPVEIRMLRHVARFLMRDGFKFHQLSDPVEQVRNALSKRRDARRLCEAADWVASYDEVWGDQRAKAAQQRPIERRDAIN
ncbi:hypothetical protein [Pandoraea sputorum]